MLVELRGVSHTYFKDTPFAQKAVRNVNLSVSPGEFLGIIGPTASGKSTLIQIVSGLIRPSEGEVFINEGVLGRQIKPRDLWKDIGLVFQLPESQIFEETVFDDVAFGPRNLDLSEREVERRVKEALELVELEYNLYKDRSPFALSGGELRKVAIAGVLAIKPSILILDEPTSGLDSFGQRKILSYLRYLHQKEGTTILLVSHNMDEVSHVAERLIVLNEGEIILNGNPREIFLKPKKLRGIGLEIPQLTILTKALRKRGMNIPEELFELTEIKEAILEAVKERA